MTCNWPLVQASEFVEFNPKISLKKEEIAPKISMEDLTPFTKNIGSYSYAPYRGGSKFINGDILFARITPCLENGKTAYVDCLNEGEVGFGSTEFIVLRAIKQVSDPNFVYYLSISPQFRSLAIKSMVGSSGRQRVQLNALANYSFRLPPLSDQKKIANYLSSLDKKIFLNQQINDNLEQLCLTRVQELIINSKKSILLSNIANVNPLRNLKKGTLAKYIDMPSLGINSSMPSTIKNKVFDGGQRFCNGDTLIARISPCLENGKGGFVNYLDEGEIAFGSTEYIVINSRSPKVVDEVLYFITRLPDFREYAIKHMTGSSGRQRLPAQAVQTYELGDISSQKKIDSVNDFCRWALQVIKNNFWQNQKLITLRDSLLPNLLSGKIKF